MPYCEKCGAQLSPDANFCGNCGTPRKLVQQSFITETASPSPIDGFAEQPLFPTQTWKKASEQVAGFIIVSKSRKLGGQDYFTGILTNVQVIFVPMDEEMLAEIIDATRQDAEKAKSPADYPYQEIFLGIPPSAILNQMPGSFSVQNFAIKEIALKITDSSSEDYTGFEEYELQVITVIQTFTFRMAKKNEYVNRLMLVHQGKVKVPQNY